jgi:PAS domain S-box-containing protein
MTKHKILPIPLASSDANAMLEDYMSKLEQKVFDQTHQLKVITDNASSCLFLLDQNGCATYMNPAAQKVTGYTLEDVTGKPILTFLHIANPLHEGSLYRCLLTRGLQGPAIVKDQEDVFTRKDGSGYFVSYSVTPLVRRDTPDGFLLEFQDSTKRKDLERQREEFLGIVSHELKTPVTSMKSYTQVLQRQFEQRGDMETARSLAKIDAQINKLTSLIGDLLDVTRVETGHLKNKRIS